MKLALLNNVCGSIYGHFHIKYAQVELELYYGGEGVSRHFH